jgi:hypothetical protein
VPNDTKRCRVARNAPDAAMYAGFHTSSFCASSSPGPGISKGCGHRTAPVAGLRISSSHALMRNAKSPPRFATLGDVTSGTSIVDGERVKSTWYDVNVDSSAAAPTNASPSYTNCRGDVSVRLQPRQFNGGVDGRRHDARHGRHAVYATRHCTLGWVRARGCGCERETRDTSHGGEMEKCRGGE